MAVSTPEGWERFNRGRIESQILDTAPTILTDRAPGFSGIAMRSFTSPGRGRGAMFLRGSAPMSAQSLSGARHLLGALGVVSPRAFDRQALRPASDIRSRLGRTLVLQQHVDGHDVVGASVKVHFSRTGEFVVTGRALADLRERTPHERVGSTESAAIRSAARAFDVDDRTVRTIKLQSFPWPSGAARWVWRASIVIDEPQGDDPVADVRAYLDASSLEVILSYNIALALTGKANVFPQNPGRTPQLREVALWDLGPAPSDRLEGARLAVLPGMPPPVSQDARDFRLAEDATGFDEANAYFQLRSALRYYTALRGRRRFASPPFRPIRAIVRDPSSRNNAYYLPTPGMLRFGDFDTWPTTRPSARSADILYHELGHAVSDSIAKLSRGPRVPQARGLSEGYSDYFANSALDDPRMCDWVAPDKTRDSSDASLRFAPDFSGDEHQTGGTWAAVLWGVRAEIGQRDADRIAFESLSLLGPSSTFADAHEALLTVSDELAQAGKIAAHRPDVIDAEWDRRLTP